MNEDRIIIRSVGVFEARRQYIAGNTIWTSPISYGSRFEMYYLDAQCVQENTTAYVFDPKVDFDKDNSEIASQLSTWMDFWNPGNHDDRTLAIIY